MLVGLSTWHPYNIASQYIEIEMVNETQQRIERLQHPVCIFRYNEHTGQLLSTMTIKQLTMFRLQVLYSGPVGTANLYSSHRHWSDPRQQVGKWER